MSFFTEKMLDFLYRLPYIITRRGYDSVQPFLADPAVRQGFLLYQIRSIPEIYIILGIERHDNFTCIFGVSP